MQGPRRRHASPRQLAFSDDEDAESTATPSIYLDSEQEDQAEAIDADNNGNADMEDSIDFEAASSHNSFSDLEEHSGGSDDEW